MDQQTAKIRALRRLSSLFRRNPSGRMSQEPEPVNKSGGEEFHELDETEIEMHELSMMVTITDLEGEVLPPGCITITNVARLLQERTGVLPFEISVLNERNVLLEFERAAPVIEISRGLHGRGSWGEIEVDIGCVLSGKVSLMNMFQEKRERAREKEEFCTQVHDIKKDQEGYQTQLTEVVQALQDRIKLVEQQSRETVTNRINPSLGSRGVPQVNALGQLEYKVGKPPELPYFSGTDPTPREEGSFEQWIFQVRGSKANHTEDAIRSGIINSVRGEARDLVEYIGFAAPLETILTRLEGRFHKTRSTDRLQYEFFQLGQEKGEGVQQYAGRLENQYKKLKLAFPERYGDAQLKERLFFGMIAGLRNATRYVYKQSEANYEALLKAAKEAELEFTESKTVNVRAKAVGLMEKGENPKIQELNNRIENLTASLKANNLAKNNGKTSSAPSSPMKHFHTGSGGPKDKKNEQRERDQAPENRKPMQCYKCGGWGHGWKDCPSPGNVDWRKWKKNFPPREEKEETSKEQ